MLLYLPSEIHGFSEKNALISYLELGGRSPETRKLTFKCRRALGGIGLLEKTAVLSAKISPWTIFLIILPYLVPLSTLSSMQFHFVISRNFSFRFLYLGKVDSNQSWSFNLESFVLVSPSVDWAPILRSLIGQYSISNKSIFGESNCTNTSALPVRKIFKYRFFLKMEVRRELTVENTVNMDEETKKMYDLGNSS